MGQPITPHAHFAMVELQALEGLSSLIQRAPRAAQLITQLIRRMQSGSGGVVVCSRETMRDLIQCSMPTLERALRILIDEGWVQRIRVGGAHAIAINHRVAWVGPRGDIQHAIFDATVIASRKEQDAIALNPPPLRPLPIIRNGEDALPFGEGEDPPSQPVLDGLHPTIAPEVDPETGEILQPLAEAKQLENLDRQRLVE